MKFVDNEVINMPWIDGIISEPNICKSNCEVYHSTRSVDINSLNEGDVLTLKASDSFLGYGLYWSTRREIAYGPVSFVLKEIEGRKVKELDIYTWYRTGDLNVRISDIDFYSNTIHAAII